VEANEQKDHGVPQVGAPVAGTDALAPDRGPFEGRYVRLAAIEPARDASALFAGSHGDGQIEDAVWRYLPYGPFDSPERLQARFETIAGSTDPMFFTVTDRASELPVGVVSYLNVVPTDRRIEIGHIWYVPSAQGGRANTDAAYVLMANAFDRWGYRRVEWKCDALNARSRAAAERLGFTFEGVFRQHMIVKGRNRDTAWFSMTDVEWPARRVSVERWLDAGPGTMSLSEEQAASREGR
jgi:RimJ/RimL family protein N-acetyltransferase